ncbi:Hypothetical protein NGAL_HAMBI2427_51920 [Neorhizobium galegae bv. orientalis]|nr:Hypothetical protein NGAL_HAMBI2427_51920 [Neorhizobium galegae bv. orientalis]
MFDLLADEDFVERLAGATGTADIGEIGEGRLQFGHEGRRPGNEPALDEIDAVFAADEEFRFRLDALGNDADAEHVGDADDILDEVALARVLVDPGDEMAVDLQIIDRIVAEQFHFAMADAEIVDRQLEAFFPHLGDQIGEFRHAGIVETLGELEADGRRCDIRLAQVLHDLFEEMFAVADQPDVEIEKQRLGREIRQAGEFRQRPGCHHLFECQKLAGVLGLIQQLER